MPMGLILNCDWADAALSQVEGVFSEGSTALRQIRDAWSGKDYAIRARGGSMLRTTDIVLLLASLVAGVGCGGVPSRE
jgi:hypothetical protein